LALSVAQYLAYDRFPKGLQVGVCRGGYHQPKFINEACWMTGCNCYCRHPAIVATHPHPGKREWVRGRYMGEGTPNSFRGGPRNGAEHPPHTRARYRRRPCVVSASARPRHGRPALLFVVDR
jgi:hypothetical protein